jgi:hypothetical protein
MLPQENTSDADFISELLSDKSKFDAYVYTPLSEALSELIKRDKDETIVEHLLQIPNFNIPEHETQKKRLVLFRNLATPNYEMHRFAACADVLSNLEPYVFEYTKDKFADINELKHMLAKMPFHKGMDKNVSPIVQHFSVIDMTRANGKKIADLETLWGQSFVEFHHDFFYERFPHMKDNHVDISDWLHDAGPNANEYYEKFMSLFLKDGILLETFLFNKNELKFNEQVILPAIINLERKLGKKPLIVALEPTLHEGEKFWNCYPPNTISHIRGKLDIIK